MIAGRTFDFFLAIILPIIELRCDFSECNSALRNKRSTLSFYKISEEVLGKIFSKNVVLKHVTSLLESVSSDVF